MTNISETSFSKWLKSLYAQQYLEYESQHLKNALRQVSGPRVLQLGDVIDTAMIKDIGFPQHFIADIDNHPVTDESLLFDPAFMPLRDETMSTIIVPHVLERHHLPHQVLRETNRVLMPEGHVILTGFNPLSLIGLQRLVFKRAACPGNYFSIKRSSDWLQLLGFEIVASSTFAYAPLIKNKRLRTAFNFLNSIGDRWLPMLGGGYMITARKKQPGGTLVGRLNFTKSAIKKRRRKLASATSHSDNLKSVTNK